jgi:hypothetical protein
MERAVRPCLPITFPKSPAATRSSSTDLFALDGVNGDLVRTVHERFGDIFH